jgi:transposase
MGMARYLVEAHLLEGRPVAELAASHGVHRSWIYKLLARYRAEGEEGLLPRSRRPRRSPTKTSQAFVSEILALRKRLSKDGFDAGAETIHTHLDRKHEQVPSAATIWRVLKAQGLVAAQPHKRPRSSYVRFCAQLPNELWQSDITCWRELEIMSVIDDHSRLCVVARAFTRVRAPDVVSTFYEAASRHGLPESLLSDG